MLYWNRVWLLYEEKCSSWSRLKPNLWLQLQGPHFGIQFHDKNLSSKYTKNIHSIEWLCAWCTATYYIRWFKNIVPTKLILHISINWFWTTICKHNISPKVHVSVTYCTRNILVCDPSWLCYWWHCLLQLNRDTVAFEFFSATHIVPYKRQLIFHYHNMTIQLL